MKKIFGFIGILLGMFMLLSAVSPAFIACAFEDEPAETAYADIQEYEEVHGDIIETYDWNIFHYGLMTDMFRAWIRFTRTYNGAEYTNGSIRLYVEHLNINNINDLYVSSFDLTQTGTHIDGNIRLSNALPLVWVDIPDDRFIYPYIEDALFYDGGTIYCRIMSINDLGVHYVISTFEISTLNYDVQNFWDIHLSSYTFNYVYVPFEFGWQNVEIVEPSPFVTLKDSVNDLLAVPILGPYLTFGTIFKLSFGILLVFICVKLFLGG